VGRGGDVISIAVVEGWRVLVSEARAHELVADELAAYTIAGDLTLTEAGARELLALTDARALDLVRRRIEGTL
jgi:hypothetical protein